MNYKLIFEAVFAKQYHSSHYLDNLLDIFFINYKKQHPWCQMMQCLKEELIQKKQSIQ